MQQACKIWTVNVRGTYRLSKQLHNILIPRSKATLEKPTRP